MNFYDFVKNIETFEVYYRKGTKVQYIGGGSTADFAFWFTDGGAEKGFGLEAMFDPADYAPEFEQGYLLRTGCDPEYFDSSFQPIMDGLESDDEDIETVIGGTRGIAFLEVPETYDISGEDGWVSIEAILPRAA